MSFLEKKKTTPHQLGFSFKMLIKKFKCSIIILKALINK